MTLKYIKIMCIVKIERSKYNQESVEYYAF